MLQGVHLLVQGITAQLLHIHQESVEKAWKLLPRVGLCPWGIQQIVWSEQEGRIYSSTSAHAEIFQQVTTQLCLLIKKKDIVLFFSLGHKSEKMVSRRF